MDARLIMGLASGLDPWQSRLMRCSLEFHPDTPCQAVTAIEVEVSRPGEGQLVLEYRVIGEIEALKVPTLGPPERTNELWRHTCFEIFVREGERAAYGEFNFSPSTRWAAYSFTGTRTGMTDIAMSGPGIASSVEHGVFTLHASIEGSFCGPLRLAISAVIEDKDGAVSYWALTHPASRPDFHHPAGFVLDLPAPERT